VTRDAEKKEKEKKRKKYTHKKITANKSKQKKFSYAVPASAGSVPLIPVSFEKNDPFQRFNYIIFL